MAMTEQELYEQIGRLSIALAEKEKAVVDCCHVIHGIKTGTINLDRLVTTETTFSLNPAPVTIDKLLEDDRA